ncbi:MULTISPECIES: LacI family DNA-binding transcriptional regulator [unclassified Streptomyces]|nr:MULTISPECIES: LacI family DNA-binding transcriptional regulator [unclassified Streptomyces]
MHVTGHTSFDGQTAPSPGRRRPVGIRAVARAAGVFHPTVSRVISGRPNVKEETGRRVEAAVRARGSRRDATAFALAGGVTRAVTVLTSNTVLRGCPATPRGLEEASRSARLALGVRVVTPEDDLDPTVAGAADTRGRPGGHRLRPSRRRRPGPRTGACAVRGAGEGAAARPALCVPTTGRRPGPPPNAFSDSGTKPCTTSRSPLPASTGTRARHHPAPRAGVRPHGS